MNSARALLCCIPSRMDSAANCRLLRIFELLRTRLFLSVERFFTMQIRGISLRVYFVLLLISVFDCSHLFARGRNIVFAVFSMYSFRCLFEVRLSVVEGVVFVNAKLPSCRFGDLS